MRKIIGLFCVVLLGAAVAYGGSSGIDKTEPLSSSVISKVVDRLDTIMSSSTEIDGSVIAANTIDLDDITGPALVVLIDSGTNTLTAANTEHVHVMPDQTADCLINLPTLVAGLHYKIIYGGAAADAQDWSINTGSDSNAFVGGVWQVRPGFTNQVSATNYFSDGTSNSKLNVLTPQCGTYIEVWSSGTNWYLNGNVLSATETGVTYAGQ